MNSLGFEFLLSLELQRGEFAQLNLSDYLTAENPEGRGKLACAEKTSECIPSFPSCVPRLTVVAAVVPSQYAHSLTFPI